MLKFYLNVKTIFYAFSTFTLVDLYISLFFLFQVKMSHALGYWWCWREIHFIASLVVYLLDKFVIIWLVFDMVDLNLNYVYDIELGYCFSLLVVIDWAIVMLLWVFVIENLWCVRLWFMIYYYFSLGIHVNFRM